MSEGNGKQQTESPEVITPVRVERGKDGRFGRGHKFSRGNPHAGTVNRLRSALLKTLTPTDIDNAINTIRDVMKNGTNVERLAAAKLLLDRSVGKAQQTIDVCRLYPMHAEVELVPMSRDGDAPDDAA